MGFVSVVSVAGAAEGRRGYVGPKVAITLRPFEVVLLEVVPAGERPTLDREFPVQPVPTICRAQPDDRCEGLRRQREGEIRRSGPC